MAIVSRDRTDKLDSAFFLLPLDKIKKKLSDGTDFKFNSGLVALDFLIRHGFTTPDEPNFIDLWFMLPAAAFLILFLAYPLGLGVWLGFTDAKIARPGSFVGFENFEWL